MVERKIRVAWLPSDATLAAQSNRANESVCYAHARVILLLNSIQVLDEEPPVYTSPVTGSFQTPAPGKKNTTDRTSPVPPPDFAEKAKYETPQPAESTSTFSNAKAAVASALPSSDELKSQLADANAQIQRLKDRLADQGLRQRKTGGEGTAAPAMMQQQHAASASGVSLQVVAALCLLSFLIAYFFF